MTLGYVFRFKGITMKRSSRMEEKLSCFGPDRHRAEKKRRNRVSENEF